jgi:hypothetical protein
MITRIRKTESVKGKTGSRLLKSSENHFKVIIRPFEIGQKEYDREMFEIEDDTSINPLPAPAFVHPEALNTDTPKIIFIPSLGSKVRRRFKSECK